MTKKVYFTLARDQEGLLADKAFHDTLAAARRWAKEHGNTSITAIDAAYALTDMGQKGEAIIEALYTLIISLAERGIPINAKTELKGLPGEMLPLLRAAYQSHSKPKPPAFDGATWQGHWGIPSSKGPAEDETPASEDKALFASLRTLAQELAAGGLNIDPEAIEISEGTERVAILFQETDNNSPLVLQYLLFYQSPTALIVIPTNQAEVTSAASLDDIEPAYCLPVGQPPANAILKQLPKPIRHAMERMPVLVGLDGVSFACGRGDNKEDVLLILTDQGAAMIYPANQEDDPEAAP